MNVTLTHELRIKRTFDAPRQLLWKAWTEQSILVQWISPKDFVTLFFDIDFRVGGAWRSSMQSGDGQTFTMHGIYLEIVEPSLLVFTHGWQDNTEHGHEFDYHTTVSIDLEEHDGQTTMTFLQRGFMTTDGRDGHNGGWNGALDKLVALVDSDGSIE